MMRHADYADEFTSHPSTAQISAITEICAVEGSQKVHHERNYLRSFDSVFLSFVEKKLRSG